VAPHPWEARNAQTWLGKQSAALAHAVPPSGDGLTPLALPPVLALPELVPLFWPPEPPATPAAELPALAPALGPEVLEPEALPLPFDPVSAGTAPPQPPATRAPPIARNEAQSIRRTIFMPGLQRLAC
jgi:hypothetical protein